MDERELKGLQIAAVSRIRKAGDAFTVPSQSHKGKRYTVNPASRHCTCPDHELTGSRCKHQIAVELFVQRETKTDPDGTKTVTETCGVRVTYTQNWPAYNAAQCGEKETFCRLLRDLVAPIETPEQKGAGQRRLPLSDMLFSAAFKVYSTVSARRFMVDMRDAEARGYVAKAPSYNSIFNVIEDEAVTPILKALIQTSALPLASIESDFAVDSTGIGTNRRFNYFDTRYNQKREMHVWLKLHAMVGTKTNIITACEVTDHTGSDSPQFVGLVEKTAEHFDLGRVTADKAYASYDNFETVVANGGVPFVPFKDSWHHGHGPNALWNKLFHYFQFNREDFLQHYHVRSNVEATFSALKRVFGDSVRSRLPVAQHNEALLKVLCHNIRMLIHAMHELGLAPVFDKFICPTIPGSGEAAQRSLGF